MTPAATRAALERIMAELAGAVRSGDVAPGWGEAAPSERSLSRLRIASPADPAFAELEVRPWDGDAVGGVEIEFPLESAPSLADVKAWFGPFEEVPPMPYESPLLRGQWWREGMPVRIVLLAEDGADGPLRTLTLQRGSVTG